MYWTAVAASADILAAIGVIVSLIYLANQVRSNAQEQIENRTQQIYEMMIATRSEIASGPLGAIMAKVSRDETLTDEEEVRYHSHLARLFNLWEVYYFNQRQGKIDAHVADIMRKRLALILNRERSRHYWQQSSDYYSQPFQDYVNGILHQLH